MSNLLFVKVPCMYPPVASANGYPSSAVGCVLTEHREFCSPLWQPHNFSDVFSDALLLCEWIRRELTSIHGEWLVEIGISEVVVYSIDGLCSPFNITFEHIASSSFYPPHILAEIGRGVGVPLTVSSSTLR